MMNPGIEPGDGLGHCFHQAVAAVILEPTNQLRCVYLCPYQIIEEG